jgi:hypothetical protein
MIDNIELAQLSHNTVLVKRKAPSETQLPQPQKNQKPISQAFWIA